MVIVPDWDFAHNKPTPFVRTMFRSDQHLIVQGKKSTKTGSKMGNKISKANVRMAHIRCTGGEDVVHGCMSMVRV